MQHFFFSDRFDSHFELFLVASYSLINELGCEKIENLRVHEALKVGITVHTLYEKERKGREGSADESTRTPHGRPLLATSSSFVFCSVFSFSIRICEREANVSELSRLFSAASKLHVHFGEKSFPVFVVFRVLCGLHPIDLVLAPQSPYSLSSLYHPKANFVSKSTIPPDIALIYRRNRLHRIEFVIKQVCARESQRTRFSEEKLAPRI